MNILNRENLQDATDGDTSMEAMLYQSFFKGSKEYIEVINNPSSSSEEVARALHSLKGLALNMGAEQLGDICRIAESGSYDAATFDAAYVAVCEQMQRIIDTVED